MNVVEHDQHGAGHAGQCCSQPGYHRCLDRCAHRRQRLEHTRVDGGDPIEGGSHVGEQHDGIVVVAIEGDPGERPPLPRRRPLGERGGLPIARAGAQHHDRWPRLTVEPLDECCPRDAPLVDGRRTELRFQELERRATRPPRCREATGRWSCLASNHGCKHTASRAAPHHPDEMSEPKRGLIRVSYWIAVATRRRSSEVIRWWWSSTPASSCTHFTVPLKRAVWLV